MLKDGVCSVEGSYTDFLLLDDKEQLPKLWLSRAKPVKDENGLVTGIN
jgi:hypothetical protein